MITMIMIMIMIKGAPGFPKKGRGLSLFLFILSFFSSSLSARFSSFFFIFFLFFLFLRRPSSSSSSPLSPLSLLSTSCFLSWSHFLSLSLAKGDFNHEVRISKSFVQKKRRKEPKRNKKELKEERG